MMSFRVIFMAALMAVVALVLQGCEDSPAEIAADTNTTTSMEETSNATTTAAAEAEGNATTVATTAEATTTVEANATESTTTTAEPETNSTSNATLLL